MQGTGEGDAGQALLQAAAEPKKAPGAPVFTLMARAGGTPGPPWRQTSGQFAAEHGISRPDSARHAGTLKRAPQAWPAQSAYTDCMSTLQVRAVRHLPRLNVEGHLWRRPGR